MKREQIIKAWKDEEYRAGLSEAERALLPEHPAGVIELTDEQLGLAGGGMDTEKLWSFGCGCWWIPGGGTVRIETNGCCPYPELA